MGVQTLRNVSISRNSNGHLLVLRDTTVIWSGMLLVLTTCIVHADMTLTRFKIMIKVTELLRFQKLPKTALSFISALPAARSF